MDVEEFISNWNDEFPNYLLTVADLKKPQTFMGALFQLFDRLGIDRDAVLMPPPEQERDDHTIYYWDLLPVINMTRVVNHVVSVIPEGNALSISIMHFLQPTINISHSILFVLFNLMLFNKDRLKVMAPYEEELFSKQDQVKILDDRKNKLLEMLNEQAQEKGKRASRLEKLEQDIKLFEDELKHEKELHDEEKQELEAVIEENRQIEMLIEQKKGHRDAIVAEVARKRALRVYDAEDIKAQAEQATQNVQEAEEKLHSLEETLKQKESSLMNLQTIKPSLDTANNLLHEIMKISESLKELECGDLESDSKEGEQDVLDTALGELRAQLDELREAKGEAGLKRQHALGKRQQQRMVMESALQEAEDRDKKCREHCKQALERTQAIKEFTKKYELDKTKGMEELSKIKESFVQELKLIDDCLLKKLTEVENKIENKLRNRSRP